MRVIAFVLASLLLVPAVAEASPALGLQTHQVDNSSFMVEVSIELDDVVAAIVRDPGTNRDLLTIVSEGATRTLFEKSKLLHHGSMATIKISLPTLRGKFNQRLSFNATGLKSLEVILLRKDGSLLPSTFTSDLFAEGTNLTRSLDAEPPTGNSL